MTPGVTDFTWLLDDFVAGSAGVRDAVAVSADGLLMAASATLSRPAAERMAAVISGLVGLGRGTARSFGWEPLEQVVVAMGGGFLFASAISDGSTLGVVADAACDVGLVGYQTSLLVERVGRVLTPTLVGELRAAVLR